MMSTEIDFTSQSVKDVFNSLQKLPPPSDFVINDITDRFADFVKSRPLDASKESLYLQHANSAFQYEFLYSIEESVSKGVKIDWNTTLQLIESILIDYYPVKHGDALMYGIYDLLKTGMEKDKIDLKYGDKIWDIIQLMLKIGTENPDVDNHSGNMDALTVSLNSLDGMSFHALYHYMRWSHKHKQGRFESDAIKIFDDYIDKKLGEYTTSRHAVLGVYLLGFYDYDREWAKQIPDRLASDYNLMGAFWGCYVCYNRLYVDIFDDLHEWYNRMFFERSDDRNYSKRAYKTTLDHLTLAYLHDLNHSEYFDRFLDNATDKDLIDHCIFFIGRIIKGKETDKGVNLAKLKCIWKNPRFLCRPGFEAWFTNSPLDQKTTIDLHLAYLWARPQKDYLYNSDISHLKKYVVKYPLQVAECLNLLVVLHKSNLAHDAVHEILKLLDENGGKDVKTICNKIKNHPCLINTHPSH